MNCPFCGMLNPDTSDVCSFCGNPLQNSSVKFRPGEEPEKIKAYLRQLFNDIRTQFPDGVIAKDSWNHERWDSPAGKLCSYLGYENGGEFLRAYGFRVVDTKPKKSAPQFDLDNKPEPERRERRASKPRAVQHPARRYEPTERGEVYRKKRSSSGWKKLIPIFIAFLAAAGVFCYAVLQRSESDSLDNSAGLTESIGNVFQKKSSDNSPEGIVTKYFKAVKTGDMENGLACFTPAIQSEYSLIMKLADSASSYFNLPVSNPSSFVGDLTGLVNSSYYKDYEFKAVNTDYQSDLDAIVTVDVYINGAKSESTTLLTKKIDGQWYIDEDNNAAMTSESTSSTANDLTWKISKTSPFSSGVAWVDYYVSPKQLVSGVIDTSGNLIMTFDDVNHDPGQFDDCGYSFYYTDNGFKIIDTHGQTTYTYQLTGTNSRVSVQAHGNRYFIIHEEISDFSSSVNQTRAIDYKGNQLGNIVLTEAGSFSYYGEGVFSDKNGTIINTVSETFYNIDGDLDKTVVMGPFSDGYTVVAYPKQFTDPIPTLKGLNLQFTSTKTLSFYYCVPSSAFASKETLRKFLETAYAEKEPLDSYGGYVTNKRFYFGEGYCREEDNDNQPAYFHSVDGSLPDIELKSFGDGISIISVGEFSNGYCPEFVRGNDGICYLVLFDKTGNPVHDPIPAQTSDYSKNGYTVFWSNDHYALSSPSGELTDIDSENVGRLYGIDEKYVYFEKKFYDIAAKSFVPEKVIPTQDTVYLTY